MACACCFNPRPRTGGDLGPVASEGGAVCFNPRPRTGGDRPAQLAGAPNQGFNPRPRTGGDHGPVGLAWTTLVSIHAPARGATFYGWDGRSDTLVSIHAPARGATLGQAMHESGGLFQSTPPHGGRPSPAAWRCCLRCFNPRPRTGGDGVTRLMDCAWRVSIHAPARGATAKIRSSPLSKVCFNPRPRTGGDTGRPA